MQNRIIAIVLMSFLCLSGCTMNRYQLITAADYPNGIANFDLTFGWKNSIIENRLKIDGYARNNRYPVISDLELRIELLDKERKVKSQQVYFFIPIVLRMDEVSSFSVTLGKRPQQGDVLRFVYRYKAIEGNDESFDWMSSFEKPVQE